MIKHTQKLTGIIRVIDDVNFVGPSIDLNMSLLPEQQQSLAAQPSFTPFIARHASNLVDNQPAFSMKDFVATKDFHQFTRDYTLNEIIGEGSYGRVHCAVNNETQH